MNSIYSVLSNKQRISAIQRLTALWAFTESGLGGIMHALHIPFTGLLVGGMAVIMICLIAKFSNQKYKQILKAALIVLIVKAMASPFTPVTAYIAVSFQALLGFALFNLLSVNYMSIILLCTIAMLESAMQKLLLLTFFFGDSLWKAMDKMVAFVSEQTGYLVVNGSYWIVVIYFSIYIMGGLLIAWFTYSFTKNFGKANSVLILKGFYAPDWDFKFSNTTHKKNSYKKLWLLLLVVIMLSVTLFFFSPDKKQGWIEVLKTATWTISALLMWFMLIGPLLTKAIQKLLNKKQSRYSDEVAVTLSFLSVLKKLTALAWLQSKQHNGLKRLYFFINTLIYATLTYTDTVYDKTSPFNNPV